MYPRALSIRLTEEDYLAFNLFTNNRNLKKNKVFRVSGIALIICGLIIITFSLLRSGFGSRGVFGLVSFTYGLLLLVFRKPLIRAGLKSQFKALKKQGTLPYDPECTMEFGEDSLREISHTQITELSYTALDQICVIPNKVVYLYKSPISGYILPMSAFTSVDECHALLRFLQSKKPDLPVHFCAE